jgi:hypothetical protein
LLILDENMGVVSYTISINPEGELSYVKGQVNIQKQLCSLMHLHESQLYLSCASIYRIALDKWPRIEEKALPHPNIKVR